MRLQSADTFLVSSINAPAFIILLVYKASSVFSTVILSSSYVLVIALVASIPRLFRVFQRFFSVFQCFSVYKLLTALSQLAEVFHFSRASLGCKRPGSE